MQDYTDADFSDAAVRRRVLEELEQCERSAAALDRDTRHDVTNAAGAARNALLLIEDGKTTLSVARLVEMARRNVRLAMELVRNARERSGGDQGNDLGRARKRHDTDTLGL